jgi:hypothetical protein
MTENQDKLTDKQELQTGESSTQEAKEFSLEDLSNDAQDLVRSGAVKVETSHTVGETTRETCTKIVMIINANAGKGAQPKETFAAIALLLQKGATSPKAPGNQAIKVGSAVVTTDMIRSACRQEKVTVRQLARALKDDIIDLMLAMGDNAPAGNLARTMLLEVNNLSLEDKLWASDFQTYNERLPVRVRASLVRNYRARFRRQQ